MKTISAVIIRRSKDENTVAIVTAEVADDFDSDADVTRLTCGRHSPPDDVTVLWGRIQLAVTEWFHDTDEGKSTIRETSYDFNVGDLQRCCDDPPLVPFLQQQGIHSLSVEAYCDTSGHRWDYDDVLFDEMAVRAEKDQ